MFEKEGQGMRGGGAKKIDSTEIFTRSIQRNRTKPFFNLM
jgi:hypothetical protein